NKVRAGFCQNSNGLGAAACLDDGIAGLGQLIGDVAAQLHLILDAKNDRGVLRHQRTARHVAPTSAEAAFASSTRCPARGSRKARRIVPGSELRNNTSPPCSRASILAM